MEVHDMRNGLDSAEGCLSASSRRVSSTVGGTAAAQRVPIGLTIDDKYSFSVGVSISTFD